MKPTGWETRRIVSALAGPDNTPVNPPGWERMRLALIVGYAYGLEFVHFGLEVEYQLTTALARLRERGDRAAVGEGFADLT